MVRFVVCLAVTMFLASAYFMYAGVMLPLTAIQKAPDPLPSLSSTDYRPPVLSEAAEQYFPDLDWVNSEHLETFESQTQDLMLFTQNTKRVFVSGQSGSGEDDGRTVEMSPVAVLWKDPRNPEARPFRLIADRALVRFQNRFFDEALELSNSRPGRVVWASLEGTVHIDGPDGLVIDGQQFILSEQSAQLYSDRPIRFRYGPTENDQTEFSGSSDQIAIHLMTDDAPLLGKDLPQVSGVHSLILRKNVLINTTFVSDGKREQAKIACDGPFEYDFQRRFASFESDVVVDHIVPNGQEFDRQQLHCQRLEIDLEPELASEVTTSKSKTLELDNLTFRRLQAFNTTRRLGGRITPVQLTSDEHQVQGTMSQLIYDALTRTAVMLDEQGVIVRQNETTFRCPRIKFTHTDKNDLETIECLGAGELLVTSESFGQTPVRAKWDQEVNVLPESGTNLHIVELNGNAEFTIPKTDDPKAGALSQVGIAADQLKVWVDFKNAESLQKSDSLLKSQLPVSRAQAIGNVAMVSRDAIIERAQTIDVRIAHSEESREATESNSQPPTKENGRSNKSDEEAANPLRVAAQSITVHLEHNSADGKVDVRKVDGRGDVVMTHQPEPNESLQELGGENPIVMSGVRVVAHRDRQQNEYVTLLGQLDDRGTVTEPAMIAFGSTRIGGANLAFDRTGNTISILGPGKLRVPVSKNLEGKELDTPGMMEVVWQERMTFDGETARFFDSIRCSFDNHGENLTSLNCENLSVRLTDRIRFDKGTKDSDSVELHSIHATQLVEFESYEFLKNQLVGVRKGQLDDFIVDQSADRFTGRGPGQFHIWSFGNSMKLAPDGKAEANRPIQANEDQSWRYSTIEFSGVINGKITDRSASLENQRIEILSAPVEQAHIKFHRDEISSGRSQAANAVWLGCRNLRINQKSFGDKDYWELFAREATELEGERFRAVADELSFDERMGRFVLRGIGREATLYFQEAPGTQFRPSSHQLIEFIPKRRSVTVDGSTGVGG
ncbi:hypothetical protein AB1L42_20905 [Thalassoglobus sp. JC818]|uniref:hypothetical protein n=1 Tax=Thalassoglobus sp. JC818 TaxID=3232136 RepID=UPI0034585872